MTKMTLEDLRKLRDTKRQELQRRDTAGKDIQLIIGMATCGIAAGARETLKALLDELEAKKVGNALVKQTGCMGLCSVEPTVEVIMPGMPTTIYGNVNAKVAKDIVDKHILNKTLVNEHVFDKPAPDVVK